jgi:hypothetical protein
MKLIDVFNLHNRLTSVSCAHDDDRDTPDNRHGDGGKAHDLSQEGKRHQAEQDRLDDQASEWIFNGKAFLLDGTTLVR